MRGKLLFRSSFLTTLQSIASSAALKLIQRLVNFTAGREASLRTTFMGRAFAEILFSGLMALCRYASLQYAFARERWFRNLAFFCCCSSTTMQRVKFEIFYDRDLGSSTLFFSGLLTIDQTLWFFWIEYLYTSNFNCPVLTRGDRRKTSRQITYRSMNQRSPRGRKNERLKKIRRRNR